MRERASGELRFNSLSALALSLRLSAAVNLYFSLLHLHIDPPPNFLYACRLTILPVISTRPGSAARVRQPFDYASERNEWRDAEELNLRFAVGASFATQNILLAGRRLVPTFFAGPALCPVRPK